MLLLAQTEAISSLQRQLVTRPTQHSSTPRSSAPEKCDMGMSTAAFRSWRRSMQCWLDLNGWAPTEAVLHIRLHCTPPLQRSLDARFTAVEWQALAVEEALEAIARIALQATNQAADWCKFFTASQERSESISEYFTRSAQCAEDCEFKCPHCAASLSEYMLLRKLVSGLESVVLKDEVFRKCESFKDVDSSHKFCVKFPIKTKQAPSASSPPSHAVNTGTNRIVYARCPHSVPSHSTRLSTPGQSLVIALDIAGAFDTVWHRGDSWQTGTGGYHRRPTEPVPQLPDRQESPSRSERPHLSQLSCKGLCSTRVSPGAHIQYLLQ